MIRKTTLAVAGLLFLGTALAAPTKYSFDQSHTVVSFGWNHLGFSNPTAILSDFAGGVAIDESDLTQSVIQLDFRVVDIDPGHGEFFKHLMSADFFDAKQYPTGSFASTSITKTGDDSFKIVGDLTLHGQTHPVTLDATLNKQGKHPFADVYVMGFDASGTLKRSTWGIDKYVPAVSDEITLSITTELHKPAK